MTATSPRRAAVAALAALAALAARTRADPPPATLAPSTRPTMTAPAPMTAPQPPSPADLAAESRRLARQVRALKELRLPDAWSAAAGQTLRDRFDATARAMTAADPAAPTTTADLLAKFANGGQPIAQGVWLFQPLPCPRCGPGGGGPNGFIFVMLVRPDDRAGGDAVVIGAAQLHAVEAHGAAFPDEVLRHLRPILAAVPAAPP